MSNRKQFSALIGVLVVLTSTVASTQKVAPPSVNTIVIAVQSSKLDQPIQEVEFARKAGTLDRKSYWHTRLESTPTSTSYDTTPPTDWQTPETLGRIDIVGLNGKEVVFVRAPGFETKAIQIDGAEGPSQAIDVILAPVLPIVGTVVQEDGTAVADAPILIGSLPTVFYNQDSYNWDLKRLAVATTDKNGRFVVKSYPVRYPLLLTSSVESLGPGYVVIAKPGGVQNAEIVLRKAVTFSGNVVLSKGRVKQLDVAAILLTTDGIPYGEICSDVTDGRGGFSIGGMPPGNAKLYISGTSPYMFIMEDAFSREQQVRIQAGSLAPEIIHIKN